MMPFLFQTAASTSCTLGGLNSNDWLGICAAIIVVSLLIASFVYVIAGAMPKKESEKIKGYVRFEYIQAILSGGLIIVILVLSSVTCNVASSLTGVNQNPFSFAQHYVNTLLFQQGIGLETSMYATSVQFGIYSGILSGGADAAASYLPQKLTQFTYGGLKWKLSPPTDFGSVFENYAGILVEVYIPILIASFAMLLIQFILLPLISGTVLTVVIPIAIVMRSLSFTGPKLRETANTFIAIGLAFYFVFPMTFIMDSQIVSWMYCSQTMPNCGNPYPQYLAPYQLNSINPSTLFASQTAPSNPFGVGVSFYQTPVAQFFSNLFTFSQGNPFTAIFYAPQVVVSYASQVSQYVFEAIVLMALNMGLTLALAIGIWRGMTAGLNFLGGESIL